VSVSQVLDLRLVQAVEAMIPLTLITLFILPLTIRNTTNGEDTDRDLASQVDSMSCVVLWTVRFYIRPVRLLVIWNGQLNVEYTYQVAKTPPAVPSVTIYALDTARTAGPEALFIPHDRKPGPPGNAPRVIKKTPPYRRLGSVPHRRIANPVMARNVNAAR
jgi:hypothetical protein